MGMAAEQTSGLTTHRVGCSDCSSSAHKPRYRSAKESKSVALPEWERVSDPPARRLPNYSTGSMWQRLRGLGLILA